MICSICESQIPDISAFCPRCGMPVKGNEECRDYTYEAFISYRHVEPDRTVAKRLQRYLENFRIPRHLESGRSDKRLGKLFRDEDELPTSSSLSAQIESALQHSRYLIVVCSPQSLESLWVQREVELFASLHGRDRIFLASVSGEPSEYIPPILQHRIVVAPDGTQTLVEEEPLAADFRKETGKKFKAEAARIAAPLIGCGYDDLQHRLRTRRTRAIVAAAGAIAAVSLAFGAFSLYQQAQIEQEHRKAQIHESELLAVEANRLLESGDRYQAIHVALSALPESDANRTRPLVPAAQLALERAVGAYPTPGFWSASYSIPLTSDAQIATSKHGAIAVLTASESIDVYDLPYGAKSYSIDKDTLLGSDSTADMHCGGIDFSGTGFVCCYGNHVFGIHPTTGEVSWQAEGKTTAIGVCAGEDVVSVLFASPDPSDDASQCTIVMYDASQGTQLQAHRCDNIPLDKGWTLLANDAGDTAILGTVGSGKALLFDADGKTHPLALQDETLEGVCFGTDTVYTVSTDQTSGAADIEAFDLSSNRKWLYQGDSSYTLNENGYVDARNFEIAEINEGKTVLASLGDSIIELDAESGIQTNHAEFSKPVLDFDATDSTFFAMLTDGQIVIDKSPFANTGSYAYIEDVTTEDLTEVEFLACGGVGMFAVGRTPAPSKISVFFMGDGLVANMVRKEASSIPSKANVYWSPNRPSYANEEGIGFLDPETFEPKTTIPKENLPLIDWNSSAAIAFSDEDGIAFAWGMAKSSATDIAIYRVSEDGQVQKGITLQNARPADEPEFAVSPSNTRLSVTADGHLLWRADDRVFLLDQSDLSLLREIPATEGKAIDEACCGTETILLLESDVAKLSGGTVGSFRLVDRQTGDTLACDLDSYSYYIAPDIFSNMRTAFYRLYVTSGFATAISPDQTRVALSCSDGATRTFSMKDGSLIWESKEIPAQPMHLEFVPDTDKMIVQDESGFCSLVSAEDGSLITSTMTALPPLKKCLWAKGSAILFQYRQAGALDNRGLVVISVLEEGFGPLMDMSGGVALSEGFSDLLAKDGNTYSIYPTLALDEGLTIGRRLAEDHPLTEAEEAFYQIKR